MRSSLIVALTILCLLGIPTLVQAEEVQKPTKAFSAFRKAIRKFRGAEKEAESKRLADEFLAAWKASGKKAVGNQRYALAQFQQAAGDYESAASGFRQVQANEEVKEKTRDYAASAEAQLLLFPELRTAIGAERIGKAVERLTGWTKGMAGNPARAKARTTINSVLARVHAMGGDAAAAHDLRMEILKEDPKALSTLARPIAQGLLGSAHTMEGYKTMSAKAGAAMKIMCDMQAAAVATAKTKHDKSLAKLRSTDPAALDADGNLKKTSSRGMSKGEKAVYTDRRSLTTAEALLEKIEGYKKLFPLLGQAAPEWTLEKAYGDVSKIADVKGKVVILDFFATWPDHLNFPVLRDLMKDFGAKGLAVVGVTATASVVYESRYDLDADHASKHTGGRLFYAARLATDAAPANPDQSIFDEAAYKTREMEALEAFIKNHELSWPVVQIAKDDASAKYALEGWPYMVVLDRQGRMRKLRAGSLSRDKTESVAAFRKMIEEILAEK